MRCPTCREENRSTARFCDACGRPLREAAEAAEPARPGDPDRRLVSVLFCDLVGSTALAERLDPEDLGGLMRAYHDVCASAIERFGGSVAQYLGDGVVAYFGYPVAGGEDAVGAVRAGLAIARGLARLPPPALLGPQARLVARVGIHTGLVVPGSSAPGERPEASALVGEAPIIAARLQEIAAPGSVIASASTLRLARGFFECRSLGARSLKGISERIEVFEVLRETGVQSRIEADLPGGLTPLVGRETELARLVDRWRAAADGHGSCVLLSGEPGIGKSRLAQELKSRAAVEGALCLECRCSPFHQHSALYPVIDLFERIWGLRDVPSEAEKLARIERGAQLLAPLPEDAVGLLASLLSVSVPAAHALPTESAQRRKQRIGDMLVEGLRRQVVRRPVLFVFEDLHWIDASSLELVSTLIDAVRDTRLLVLLLYRPTFRPPWPVDEGSGPLVLERLAPEQTVAMAERVAGGRALPPEVMRGVAARADGVPLYIEELTRMMLESGLLAEADGRLALRGPLPAFAIPETLKESLIARLDRLVPVKEVVQIGATLGRSFSYALLHAVSDLPEETLQRELARLVDAEVLHQSGTAPAASYVFRHALIQEAAYDSLLRSKRLHHHERIARTYQEHFPAMAEVQPELLAHHFRHAGLSREAVSYGLRAGQRAIERSAYVEAVGHLETGLDLLSSWPEGPERTQPELALSSALGVALMAVKGYAAPEVARVYGRARELCARSGESHELFGALWGLGTYHQARAELTPALALAQQRLEIAHKLQDRALLVQAHEAAGTVSFWRGEFTDALRHLEHVESLYDPAEHAGLALVFGQDAGVVCRAYGAVASWFLGRPEAALRRMDAALALARHVSHPYSLALALDFAASLHQLRQEPDATRRLAEQAILLSSEQQFPFWLGMGRIMHGWALAASGDAEAGIAELQSGMATYGGTGAQLGGRYCLAVLADVYRMAGRARDGWDMLSGALAALGESQDRFFDAEICRVKGELLRALPPVDSEQAEACFQEALAIARSQGALGLELRATSSLCRLQRAEGRAGEARQRLAEVIDRFHDGCEYPDLVAARALLHATD